MSGPDLNAPQPGSNAIGKFIIGTSPIGTIPLFDYWKTVISQYANSPVLTQLISNMFQYIDQYQNLDNFFDLIWNIDTAQGYGLDVWGRIIGVTRVVQIPGADAYFWFAEALPDSNGFDQAPFYSGVPLTDNFDLTDDAYRTLLFAKALSNITDGSIPALNQLLINLFGGGGGNAYVVDNGDMTMVYKFDFGLSPVQRAIVQNSGVLPRPTGVAVSIQEL